MMNKSRDFIHKLMAVERAIAAEKGDFVLFALVQRAEGIGLWDLLISAPWLGTKEAETLDFFARKLKETLTNGEMMRLSRIAAIPAEPLGPIITVSAALAFRKHQCENTPDVNGVMFSYWGFLYLWLRPKHVSISRPMRSFTWSEAVSPLSRILAMRRSTFP
jgi:hypothetical protein